MIHIIYQLIFRNKQYTKIESSCASTSTTRSQKCREICVSFEMNFLKDDFNQIFIGPSKKCDIL
jgi:hypothetical protein